MTFFERNFWSILWYVLVYFGYFSIDLIFCSGDPLAIAAAQAAHEAKKRKWRPGPDGKLPPFPGKPRKKMDRYDGMTEDELSRRILPDHLCVNLDIIIVSFSF